MVVGTADYGKLMERVHAMLSEDHDRFRKCAMARISGVHELEYQGNLIWLCNECGMEIEIDIDRGWLFRVVRLKDVHKGNDYGGVGICRITDLIPLVRKLRRKGLL